MLADRLHQWAEQIARSTPCARATSATLAPGLSVNCTISSFSETDRQRRTRRPVLNSTASDMSRSSALQLFLARWDSPYAYEIPSGESSAESEGQGFENSKGETPDEFFLAAIPESHASGECGDRG